MRTFYTVTFKHGGKTMYAIKGRKPTGIHPAEKRCLFTKESDAIELQRFLIRESTFQDILIKTINVGKPGA